MARRKIKIGGLSLEEPEEISLGREAICKALKKADLFLKTDIGTRYLEAKLTHREAVPISEDEPGLVVPFVNSPEWRFWLGMQLKFKLVAGEGHFQSASLMVLRSALRAGDKVKILRAEWERFDDPAHRNHAQPHWHVYTTPLAQGGALQRFHFAMATGWHAGEAESHYRAPSPTGIASWIQACVTYTRSQLIGISN